ncbi:MAG: MauE/DoxX family redox-associated membrane protein [Actinomycetota bacterium]
MTTIAARPLAILVDRALLSELVPQRLIEPALTSLAPLAALATALVFGVAAATKLADRPSTVADFAAIGLPRPALLARLVPAIELAIVVLLLLAPAVGATLAAVALVAFTAVLASALRAGRRVSCGCLGPLSRRPISTATLWRNVGLLALTAVAAATPAPPGLLPTLPAGDVVLAVGPLALLTALGVQLLTLRSQLGRIWSVELAGEPDRRRGRRTAADGSDAEASSGGDSLLFPTTHPSTDTGVTT